MHPDERPPQEAPRRAPRRDALRNRERLIAGALRAFARDGMGVPVADIAKEAGVGVATFYRCFADRHALVVELEHRAYDTLIAILEALVESGLEGLPAVQSFLVESVTIADLLILPLHGAPPLVDQEAVRKRQAIDSRIEVFLAQARAAGTVRRDVNATDVIICSALVTQPLRQGPDWSRSAARHVTLFVAGIASEGDLPSAAVLQRDIESTFRDHVEALPAAAPPGGQST